MRISATGFHPEPSAKAPCTRTIVLTAAYAGDDASMTAAHRHGICNSEKRGAFGMSKKNWDRVPIDAQSIDAPLSRAAVFLVVTVASELTALTKVCLALDGLDDLVKTVGFRDLSARLSRIVGIGRS